MIIEVSIDKLPDRYSRDLGIYKKTKDITELRYYKRMIRYHDAGWDYWKDLNDEGRRNKIKEFLNLYRKIKKYGWKDEPYINGVIDSCGIWRIKGGYHRISVLKYLDYKTVKVNFKMHPKFEKFYNYIYGLYKKNRMYQPINHIVFSTWSCVRGQNRGELISKHIKGKAKILDIGSYLGNISFTLGKYGYNVTGLDANKWLTWASDYINKFYKLPNVKFITNDALEFFSRNTEDYDVIIMLSVDRWIKKQSGNQGLRIIFKDIAMDTKHFFFESRGKHEKEALEIIRKWFEKEEIIGYDDGETHRRVWHFWHK